MNWIPQNYEAPRSQSNYYLKLQEGENRIRILSKPVLGWEDWDNKRPVRYQYENKPAKSCDPTKPVKHFWAFVVFNYNEEQIQVMHVTQATIRKALEALCRDNDWGSPYNYDIKIIKTGEGVDTEYSVNPVPHKQVDGYLISCFNERRCNLEALFDNGDPFSREWDSYTELASEESVRACAIEKLPEKQSLQEKEMKNLKIMFAGCDKDYQSNLMNTLSRLPKPVKTLDEIPMELFTKIRDAVEKNYFENQESEAMSSSFCFA
jgi:hypothetical protein